MLRGGRGRVSGLQIALEPSVEAGVVLELERRALFSETLSHGRDVEKAGEQGQQRDTKETERVRQEGT